MDFVQGRTVEHSAYWTEEHKGHTIRIMHDQDPESPREWDNLGCMVCFHGRYNLGDNDHGFSDPDDFREFLETPTGKSAVIMPLYLYDHSGITMSTGTFSCPWDSGQVGYIYANREKVLREFNRARMTRKLADHIRRILTAEVETYDQFLTGDVYGFEIEKDGESLDSCWGFYGFDYCQTEARQAIA